MTGSLNKTLTFLMTLLLIFGAAAAQVRDPILLQINGKNVSSSEFEKQYIKSSLHGEPADLDEYLELFINYQLKVLDAKQNELHKTTSFQEEMRQVRTMLAQTYLTHPETEEIFLKEAYERMQFDLNVSHILIRIPIQKNPADTMYAWEKAMILRNQIMEGEPFESAARRASDDPSASFNHGNLGYFTAFQMIYPFEKAAYDLQVGEVSNPVRTNFGYHLIRLNDKRPSPGEVKLRHILVRFSADADEETISTQIGKMDMIMERIKSGEDFGVLAAEYSEDHASAQFHGEMNWFGAGQMIPDFEQMAFSMTTPGEMAGPFQTPYGLHLIKLMGKRNLPSYENLREEIRQKIHQSRDERNDMIRKALVEKLKSDFSYSPDQAYQDELFDQLSHDILEEKNIETSLEKRNQALFILDGEPVSARDFALFIQDQLPLFEAQDVKDLVRSLYQEFLETRILERENYLLEKKYPEFRFLINEYFEGLLLFDISEQKIWNRSVSDSLGLANFYNKNKARYMGPQMIDLSIYKSRDKELLGEIHQNILRTSRRKYPRPTDVYKFNRRLENTDFTSERSVTTMDSFPQYKASEFKRGITRISQKNEEFMFLVIYDELKPLAHPLESIRGLVISDYQDYLEEMWVKELRNNYTVRIDKQVLADLKKKLNNQKNN